MNGSFEYFVDGNLKMRAVDGELVLICASRAERERMVADMQKAIELIETYREPRYYLYTGAGWYTTASA